MSVILDADPLGKVDAAAQLSGGMADALSKGTKAILPGGSYLTLGPVIQPAGLLVEGEGKAQSRIRPHYESAEPAWVLAGDGAELRDIGFRGYAAPVLGKRVNGLNGVRIDGKGILRDVRVDNFDSGIIFNSLSGHIVLRDAFATNNFYGIDQRVGNGDHLIDGGEINGNMLANIRIPGDVVGDGIQVRRTHLGYAPHSILHTAHPTPAQFLSSCTFLDARFEATGNTAIYSENFAAPGKGGINGCTFINPGHSWWPQRYRLPDRPYDYAIKAGYSDRSNVVVMGEKGFTPGSSGSWLYIDQNYATWLIVGENQSNNRITVRSGHAEFLTRLFGSEAGFRAMA